MDVKNCKFINIQTINDYRGNIAVIENTHTSLFKMQRIYYLYDVPYGADRGGHAHKKLEQIIIAVSGSFKVTLDDGKHTKSVILNNPSQGLYICPMIWRTINSFSSGAVALVIASQNYEESDYFRDYGSFKDYLRTS
jgi:uncharacterized RmlC-like cupin family protein